MDSTVNFLHEFFEATARRWPDHLAIDVPPSSQRSARRSLTYAELKRQSDALAHVLRDFVTRDERIIVIILPRASERLYVAQLAVLKVGAAFACVDPAFPDGQVRAVLDDSEAAAILTDAEGMNRVRRLHALAPALNVVDGPETTNPVPDPVAPAAWRTTEGLA